MFTDSRTLESGTLLEVDLCVVGAGAAGLATTLGLVGSRHSVVILESGGRKARARIRRLAEGKARGRPIVLRNQYLRSTRNRVFGGLGEDWHGSCRPLDPEDFAERDWAADSGWPLIAADLAPYRHGASEFLGIDPRTAGGAGPAELFGDDERFDDSSQPYSPRRSISKRFRARFEDAANVDVLLHANVVAIELDPTGERVVAVGVRCFDGPSLEVRARHFVLAAGALESARLLLASNGQRTDGLGNAHGLVGRHFMDQIVMRAGFVVIPGRPEALAAYDRARPRPGGNVPWRAILHPTAHLQQKHELLNSLVMLRPVDVSEAGELALEAGRAALAAGRLAKDAAEPGENEPSFGEVTLRGEQLPSLESRMQLGEKLDELGMPQINLDWRLGEHDLWSLRTTARLFAESVGQRLVGRVRLYPVRPLVQQNFAPGGHQSGTARMSHEPSKGVVDTDCRMHELPNLFIAGSAVFPTSGCSGPMLTLVALSLRLGEHLRRLLEE